MGDGPSSGPGLRDWALLAVSLVFVAAGVLMLPTQRDTGVVSIAFFGLCAGVAILNIRRALRDRRARTILDVRVVGGTRIRESRARALTLGGVLAALGLVLAGFGGGMGLLFQVVGGFIALVGLVLLLGIVGGRVAAGFIMFEPEGLVVGRPGCSYRVPWDDIVEVGTARIHDNPVLLLHLHEPDGIEVMPPRSEAAVRRQFASNERWVGVPIAFMTASYGIDLGVLAHATERYARNPSSRTELGWRRLS